MHEVWKGAVWEKGLISVIICASYEAPYLPETWLPLSGFVHMDSYCSLALNCPDELETKWREETTTSSLCLQTFLPGAGGLGQYVSGWFLLGKEAGWLALPKGAGSPGQGNYDNLCRTRSCRSWSCRSCCLSLWDMIAVQVASANTQLLCLFQNPILVLFLSFKTQIIVLQVLVW